MVLSAAPSVPEVGLSLSLGGRVVDLASRALVVAVVPPPRWAREMEVVAGVRAAAGAGADLVEVPAEPRLVGPAAGAGDVPVAARVDGADAAHAAHVAGASVLIVPSDHVEQVVADPRSEEWQVAVLVERARGARDAVAEAPDRPVVLDVTSLDGPDAVSEEALAISVGARLIRTGDVRRSRRVIEVMAHLLQARAARSSSPDARATGAGGQRTQLSDPAVVGVAAEMGVQP